MENSETLRAELSAAPAAEDFVRIANDHGYPIEAGDLPVREPVNPSGDLTEAELAAVSGGYTFPVTDWIYCDNPWTNVWCTLKC
jgi:predicted ribosomally synthesized peptide with nif11-like leader